MSEKGLFNRSSTWALLFAVVGSSVVAAAAHELWRAHLGVPLLYSQDSLPHALAIRQVVDDGWFFSDNRLGAPFGQHFADWPLPDTIHLVYAKFLGLFFSGWPAVVNVMYLSSYPVVAASAWWVMRRIGVTPWTSAVLAILYSLLPYHAVRNENHLFLAIYYTVPLGIYLVWWVATAQTLFPVNEKLAARSRWLSRASWGSARTVGICILVGCSGAYYTAFTLVFLVAGAVAALVATANWRVLLPAAAVGVLLAGVLVLNTAPSLIYSMRHGENLQGLDRLPGDSELFGLKLAQMVLPLPDHRIDALAKVSSEYYAGAPLPGEGPAPALGIIGVIGLAILLSSVLFSSLRRYRSEDLAERRLGMLALTGILVGTVGGISTVISLYFTTAIRSWNRISIFIAFFALIAVGLRLDQLLRASSAGTARVRKSLSVVMLGLVLIVGSLDQTSKLWVPRYDEVSAAFLDDQKYFAAIEATMPAGAGIFQAPRQSFPEGPGYGVVGSYEQLQPYMHTDKLRWSFGGIKGRIESEWQSRLHFDNPDKLLPEIVATGFDGLYVDRRYFLGRSQPFESAVTNIAGVAPFVDATGNKAFYDLRAYATRERNQTDLMNNLRKELLFPAFVETANVLLAAEGDGKVSWQWAKGDRAELRPYNAGPDHRRARISFSLQTATGAAADFEVQWPGGAVQPVHVGTEAAFVTREVELPKNWSSPLVISTNAPALPGHSRDLHFRLVDLDVKPA